jgi:flavin-dependent dehydrogenase
MNPHRPIEIIGGGLAGLSLGLALRRAGVAVSLHETGDYPRHRVCGEFITGLDTRTIARLGLAPFLADALRHREVGWFIKQKLVRTQRLPQPALGISRHHLDARLAEAFVAAGGKLHTHSRIASSTAREGRVIATGKRATKSRWIGLKIHALDLPLDRDLEIHLGTHAYVGLARVDANRVNVCGLFQRRDVRGQGRHLLLGYLHAAGLDKLAARLAAAATDPASFCAIAGVGFNARLRTDDSLRLGDAGALIPPFTGNGMAMAFQGAAIALDPLVGYAEGRMAWPETVQKIHTGLKRRFGLRLAAAAALHPFLLDPPFQRWLAAFTRAELLPLRPLYAALH